MGDDFKKAALLVASTVAETLSDAVEMCIERQPMCGFGPARHVECSFLATQSELADLEPFKRDHVASVADTFLLTWADYRFIDFHWAEIRGDDSFVEAEVGNVKVRVYYGQKDGNHHFTAEIKYGEVDKSGD